MVRYQRDVSERTRAATLTMARGKARHPKGDNPNLANSRRLLTGEWPGYDPEGGLQHGSYSRPILRELERFHATLRADARRRSLGASNVLSGERRQALEPEPTTSPGQCELRRLTREATPRLEPTALSGAGLATYQRARARGGAV